MCKFRYTRPLASTLLAALVSLAGLYPAYARYAPDLDPGYSLEPVDSSASLSIDLNADAGKAVRAAFGPEVRLTAAWQVRAGMWRDFELRSNVKPDATWVVESTRIDSQGKPEDEVLASFGTEDNKVLVAVGQEKSWGHPDVSRAFIYGCLVDRQGKVTIKNRYEVQRCDTTLDSRISHLDCNEVYCLDFFGDGKPTLVVGWSDESRTHNGMYGADGVEVITVEPNGELKPCGSGNYIPDTAPGEWGVADLSHNGKWAVLTRFELAGYQFMMRCAIQPSTESGPWKLVYEEAPDYYAPEQQFYEELYKQLKLAASDSSGTILKSTKDGIQYIDVMGHPYYVDDFIEHGKIKPELAPDITIFINKLRNEMRGAATMPPN